MLRRSEPARAVVPAVLSLLLLLSRLSSVPALSDPARQNVPPSLHLTSPLLYTLVAPLFTLWDGVSMLSISRLKGFLLGLALMYLLWRLAQGLSRRGSIATAWRFWGRELGLLLLSLAALLIFLTVGAVWHRPMLSLAGTSPRDLVVDFHSHTNASRDVRDTWMRHFDLEANLRWHARAGFQVVFVTDHNVSRESRVTGRESRVRGHKGLTPLACPGIEVSAWQAHIVLLGDTLPVDRDPYSRSLAGLLDLLRNSESAYGSLSVASLPEYRRSHWNRLDTLVQAGLDGFEIVNASPKANELTRKDRDRVIQLAQRHNLFVTGVSDSHGWGATSMVWNLVEGASGGAAAETCNSILQQLRRGFSAVRVIERHRLRPDDWWPLWLTPVGVVWETWRSMGWELTLSWLLWIWLLWAGRFLLRTPRPRAKIAE